MIYLDYASTCPVDDRVVKKMVDCLTHSELFGNSGSEHALGITAKQLIENAREQVSQVINSNTKEVVFTSGATESNNLAIKGVAYASLQRKKTLNQKIGKHIITAQTEHKAVLDCCAYLTKKGFKVTYLTPDINGEISAGMVASAIREDTCLVSLMAINNETGIVNDLDAIGKITRANQIVFHVDGAQAVGKIALDVEKSCIDLLSLSAHKAYGPKGIGVLYIRRKPRVILESLIHGGGQERGFRSGTLPTHQIIGMGEAFYLAKKEFKFNNSQVKKLHDYLFFQLKDISHIYIGGITKKVCHTISLAINGIKASELINSLDNICLSLGSACSAASNETSHVLKAMGVSDTIAQQVIRISLSHLTTTEQIDELVTDIKIFLEKKCKLHEL